MYKSSSKPKKSMNQQMNYYAHCSRIMTGGMGMKNRRFTFADSKDAKTNTPPKKRGMTKKKFHRQKK